VYDLLTKVENIREIPTEEKWQVHHDLLSVIPMVETMLNVNGFGRTDKIIERIKAVAETVSPASNLVCYT